MDPIYPEPFGFGNPYNFRQVRNFVKDITLGVEYIASQHKLSHMLGGNLMKIKFDRYESTKTNPNASGKTYNIYRVYGTALDGKMAGQEWNTQFFVTQKEMAGQVKSLQKGDIVNVKMKKNGNYWNPESFEKVTDNPVVNPGTGAGTSTSPNLNAVITENPRRKNMEIAVNILGEKGPKKDSVKYMEEAAGIADMIDSYVNKTGMFQFDDSAKDGIPAEDDNTDPDPDITEPS